MTQPWINISVGTDTMIPGYSLIKMSAKLSSPTNFDFMFGLSSRNLVLFKVGCKGSRRWKLSSLQPSKNIIFYWWLIKFYLRKMKLRWNCFFRNQETKKNRRVETKKPWPFACTNELVIIFVARTDKPPFPSPPPKQTKGQTQKQKRNKQASKQTNKQTSTSVRLRSNSSRNCFRESNFQKRMSMKGERTKMLDAAMGKLSEAPARQYYKEMIMKLFITH